MNGRAAAGAPHRRPPTRAVYLRRRVLAAGGIAAAVAAFALAVAPSSPHAPPRRSSTRAQQTAARQSRHTLTLTKTPPPSGQAASPPPSPGSLPQTHAYPSADTAQFHALMSDLWAGIVHGTVGPARAAFFPQGAYLQLKAIAGAGSDWTDRLVHDYALDIGAAHALLGTGSARASLISVSMDASYGHWITPGVCDNRLGYYEMPNARMVYREDGQIRSLGIASMISWRGVWYVVHFGAILRSSDVGTVDAPASGAGIQAYSATC